MADRIVDSFNYSDSGRVIRKDTWEDDSGQQWDTFTPVGQDSSGSANGTVLSNQSSSAQNMADQYYGQAVRDNSTNNAANNPAPNRNNSGLASRQPEATPASPYSPAPSAPTSGSAAYPTANTGGSSVSVNPSNPFNPAPVPGGPSLTQTPPPTGPVNSPGTNQAAGNQGLYNWDNPTQAVVNAMRASGNYINTGNPVFQMLMRAAPGLADAFLINGAGANQQSPDYFKDFGSFLSNALSQGNVPGILKQAQGSLGSIIPQARAYRDADQAGSPNPLAGNTLLGSLSGILNNNSGSGALDVLNNLNTPLMNRSSASAYQGLLGGPNGLGAQANFNLNNDLTQNGSTADKDFWYYLLGR